LHKANDEETEELKRKIKFLEDEVRTLKEQQELQKSNWLYSHNTSYAILSGLILALISSLIWHIIFYITVYYYPSGSQILLFVLLIIPLIPIYPFIFWVKAPRFAYKSYQSYVISFLAINSIMTYKDPFAMFHWQSHDIALNVVSSIAFLQTFLLFLNALFIPSIANYFGYRLILDGAIMVFEVHLGLKDVLQKLVLIEEDFKLSLVDQKQNRLHFVKTVRDEKQHLQVFLHEHEGKKTLCTLVMHQVKNDIPMKVDHESFYRLGKTIMSWLKINCDCEVSEKIDLPASMFKDINQEARKIFLRRPLGLSKYQVSLFIKSKWKDIALIVSVLAALIQVILQLYK
jgi:hypothetical protein